ncbi:type IV secretory system conjugative DNA transfer family protein [Amycolatopsis rubida]|uniref:Type IV secretory pathway, VirD4 component, TraG/TraD family ATPase n=1 Tax=Amycolatopsis rubida TaxID=112413 RepID=A0A1I5XGB5_9PSEU|nr:type IV secretory system conjugative DNA transfer family protein [Amycolatopsis rubida]SFQ30964.1 Type IV secretory pathway, VirD4 component, TraG/TraD family ATPase [Amycolatopsis rubida]
MTSPTSRRHASGATPVLPWVIVGLIGSVFLLGGMVWVAAQAGAAPGFPVPSPGSIPTALRRPGLTGLIGPGGSEIWFWIAFGAQIAVLLAAAITVAVLIAKRGRPRDGHRAMNSAKEFRELQQPAMAKRAQGLRPSLADARPRDLAPRQIGAALGDIGGRTVYKSHEDVELVICGPRSNKTSAKVVPEILSAPGTVVATSNKGDVWALTAGLRALAGEIYLFDCNHITYQPQTFWWSPLAGVSDVESASRMAAYFMREVGGGAGGGTDRADPFFTPAAEKTLRQILLAAAVSGHSLRDVVHWVSTRSDEPAVQLDRHGFGGQGDSLRATLELPPETRGGVYEGVATAISCLDSEALLRWVTPPLSWQEIPKDPGLIRELNLWDLITRPGDAHPTLYLLTREGQGSGRPIVAAMVGELCNVAFRAAAANGGRLDPPMTLQLDEAANIVRIPELPGWYSWFGSQSIMVTTVLQSREQGRSVWGKEGFDALWSAATIKTIGAGIADPDFAEDLSRLVGDHKVEETSNSYSSGGPSTSRQLHTERILTAADIAAMPRTNALLITSGRRPGMLRLRPWYAEPDGEEKRQLVELSKEATAQIQQSAIDYLGPDNPVAKSLRPPDATAQTRPRS